MVTPVARFRDGVLECVVWANTKEHSGKVFYSVTLERLNKDGDDPDARNLRGDQALKAAHLLVLAHEEMRRLRDVNPASGD